MSRITSGLVAAALLTMGTASAFGAEPRQAAAVSRAVANASAISRAERALRDYLTASSAGNEEAVVRTVTSDAIVEYALNDPGSYLVVDAASTSVRSSAIAQQLAAPTQISTLKVFPTNDSNVVFVHYTTSPRLKSVAKVPEPEHLALLELRGEKIARLRYFSTTDGTPQKLDAFLAASGNESSLASAAK